MNALRILCLASLALGCACARAHAKDAPVKFNPPTNAVPASVHLLKAEGIENFYQLTGRIYSGSAPDCEPAFAELKARGVKTIVTVDGAKPDVETARRYGIRYVHLPIGYDGVPTNQAIRLVKAAETLPGPIYVHCHHGLHRGPAGAAVICMGTEGWTPEQAESWMNIGRDRHQLCRSLPERGTISSANP